MKKLTFLIAFAFLLFFPSQVSAQESGQFYCIPLDDGACTASNESEFAGGCHAGYQIDFSICVAGCPTGYFDCIPIDLPEVYDCWQWDGISQCVQVLCGSPNTFADQEECEDRDLPTELVCGASCGGSDCNRCPESCPVSCDARGVRCRCGSFEEPPIPGPPPPAPGGSVTGTCGEGSIYSALGCLPFTTLTLLQNKLAAVAAGIAGGIAMILIIIAGFQIQTSQGDPRKLQGARELMLAAVGGLILLLFSSLLLRVAGVNILNILPA